MKLEEAKQILKNNGYILEEWLPGTGTCAPSSVCFKRNKLDRIGRMNLFRAGKPTKTFQILEYLYNNTPNGIIWGKDLCRKFFNDNYDNMRTWLTKNSDYILSDLIKNRRFYKISKIGIKAIQEALDSF